MLASIVSINTSKGGIPKLPINSVRISTAGLEGDEHNHAKHNSPIQAVCIQDLEKLEELSQKGYHLSPGQAGENLTVKNLHVNSLALGTVLEFSGGVILKISKVRKPCYVMDAIDTRLKSDAIGRHGMYASVLKEGILMNGETITVVNHSEKYKESSHILWPHTGAIFCGGKSRRMGFPKASFVLPSGVTMIEHVYNTLKQLCKQVVLVGHGEGVPDSLGHLCRIQDNYQGLGPIGALEALLSSGLDSEYLISPCDLSKVVPEIFPLLMGTGVKLPAIFSNNGRLEPLLGRYPSSLLPHVRKHIAEKQLAMNELLKAVSATTIEIPQDYIFALSNINSPQDLA